MAVARWIAGLCLMLLAWAPAGAQEPPPLSEIGAAVDAVMPKVIAWRRDIHQNPELSNREFRTAELVAGHLRELGLEVETGIAHTGVVAILRGGRPGGVVALRADMDALPVEEKSDLSFASKATSEYLGATVPVAHACGHDAHTAMLMGAAEVLASMRAHIPGTIKFIFQPAEEGPPPGEQGGAELMIEDGVLDDPAPTAIFAMHVMPGDPGKLYHRAGAMLASSDRIYITVTGRQTHGAKPWGGIDTVSIAAEIITAINGVASRQLDISRGPVVITIATVHGGVRHNIIPDTVELTGTLRTFDPETRLEAMRRVTRTAEKVAESWGAEAEVTFTEPNLVTYNDPALAAEMVPSLVRAAGDGMVAESGLITGAEDFSFFQQKIPGFYYRLGINKPGVAEGDAAPNHSPYFFVNEDALAVGVRAHVVTALDYLARRAEGR